MTVKALNFEEDTLKRAAVDAIHMQADADWGGDADRQSTSGIMVWVKSVDGMWYMVQAISRKQTTVALSTGEAELISVLGGVCEMIGVGHLCRWMIAEGDINKMIQQEEIIGSDSKVGISILRRRGSTRRT